MLRRNSAPHKEDRGPVHVGFHFFCLNHIDSCFQSTLMSNIVALWTIPGADPWSRSLEWIPGADPRSGCLFSGLMLILIPGADSLERIPGAGPCRFCCSSSGLMLIQIFLILSDNIFSFSDVRQIYSASTPILR